MRNRLYRTLIVIVALAMISACSSTRNVSMETMRPADISISPEINSLVLVDRTKFKKEFHNIAEGILTGEMPGQDKAAIQATLSSLSRTLQYSPRFSVKVASERIIGNSLTAAFPDPLSWEEVRALCEKYGTDAVLAIEIFDTDFIVTEGSKKVKKTVGEGDNKREVTVDEFYAEGIADIMMGIRLYDPAAKSIIDQDVFRHSNTWKESADSPAQAIAKLINRVNATSEMGRVAGADYAYKISPMPVRITRSYYKKSKKSPEVLMGARKAEVNDWKGAAIVWKRGLNDAPEKDAGRLTYNLAVASEVLGEYDLALTWARESYVKYGNKKARTYVSSLERRMYDEEMANRQMSR